MPEKWAIPVCGRPKFGHGQVVPATHTRTRAARSSLYCQPLDLPDGFPYEIQADGREWCWTGKVGTDIKTGQPSAEYGTDAIRYWRRADGTITPD